MLDDFFESPEIAVIFATKEKDKEIVDTNESSRLRIGKHSRKREPNTKRAVRSKVRGHRHNSADMFSARKSRADNEERIASLHERIDYFDYDDETGKIIKKKHSVFNFGSKRSSVEYDKPESDVDIKGDKFMKQVTGDLNNGGDSYCPSDSAYETNHDDITDSLERLMIKDDNVAIEDSMFDNESREGNFGTILAKRESPYQRCRSSAICGRNCEICRGKNNQIMLRKHKQSKKHAADIAPESPRGGKAEASHQKYVKANDKSNIKNCGMFSSKARTEKTGMSEKFKAYFPNTKTIQRTTESGQDLQVESRYKDIQVDSQLQENLEDARYNSSLSPNSGPSLDNIDSSMQEDYYYREPLYSSEYEISNGDISSFAYEPVEFADNGEYDNEYLLPKLEHDHLLQEYDAFSRGPHLMMLYDFRAEHEDDISVWKGEVVLLLDNRDRDWVWVATHTSEEGYVPRSLTVPYCYCGECRQEELRQREISEKDDVGSSTSIPRSMSSNSMSSLTSLRSNTKNSEDSSLLKQRQESTAARIISHDNPETIFSETVISLKRETPELHHTLPIGISGKINQVPSIQSYNGLSPQSTGVVQKQTSSYHTGSPVSTESQMDARKNSLKNIKRSGTSLEQEKQSFGAESVNNISPKLTSTKLRQSSVSSNLSQVQLNKSNSIPYQSMLGHEKLKDMLAKDSIKLVALSSYRTDEQGKLNVDAGDVVYVHMKDQIIPNWLWVYSPESNNFGFIPESVVDQLKSSIV